MIHVPEKGYFVVAECGACRTRVLTLIPSYAALSRGGLQRRGRERGGRLRQRSGRQIRRSGRINRKQNRRLGVRHRVEGRAADGGVRGARDRHAQGGCYAH